MDIIQAIAAAGCQRRRTGWDLCVMLILTRAEVAQLLDLSDCIDAIERAFVQHARGELPTAPGILGVHVFGGGYHVKTAALGGKPGYFAAKINANFRITSTRAGCPQFKASSRSLTSCPGYRSRS